MSDKSIDLSGMSALAAFYEDAYDKGHREGLRLSVELLQRALGYNPELAHLKDLILQAYRTAMADEAAERHVNPVDTPAFDLDILELGIDTRTYNALTRVGYDTVPKLLELTQGDAGPEGGIRNFGPKSLALLDRRLAEFGLMRIEPRQKQ